MLRFEAQWKTVAYVAINEDQAPEYSEVDWLTDVSKVLVINRLSVHPEVQGKGMAKKVLRKVI